MPCPVAAEFQVIIDSDAKMIRTYLKIYVVVAIVIVGTFLYLHRYPIKSDLDWLIKGLVTTVAFPVLFQHLKRKNGLTSCRVYQLRAQQHAVGDPECIELKNWIDEELKRRIGQT